MTIARRLHDRLAAPAWVGSIFDWPSGRRRGRAGDGRRTCRQAEQRPTQRPLSDHGQSSSGSPTLVSRLAVDATSGCLIVEPAMRPILTQGSPPRVERRPPAETSKDQRRVKHVQNPAPIIRHAIEAQDRYQPAYCSRMSISRSTYDHSSVSRKRPTSSSNGPASAGANSNQVRKSNSCWRSRP